MCILKLTDLALYQELPQSNEAICKQASAMLIKPFSSLDPLCLQWTSVTDIHLLATGQCACRAAYLGPSHRER